MSALAFAADAVDEHAALPASHADMFVEIVRDERDQSLTLNFRRKGRAVDGQAFFCLCRADASKKQDSLFQRLSTSTCALKRFAVQSDTFHHTGVLECGYCTVHQSVGMSRLHNIQPNVPYVVAIAIHSEGWSKRALSVKTTTSMRTEGGVVERSLGDDATPFVDKVVLRELKEQGGRLRPAFHVAGRNPWGDNLIPSLECARYLALQCHAFFKKSAIHLQTYTNRAVQRDANGSVNDDGSMRPALPASSPSRVSSPALQRPLLERQLTIHGVTDPLCGAFVSFLLTLTDAVNAFRCVRGHTACGSPPGAPPNAGDLLEAISVLGSRVQHSSLSASWIVDWYDILLLVCLDGASLRRVVQAATQFKSFDIEGQTLEARLAWMLRPEKRVPAAGSLVQLFVAEANRLGLEHAATARGNYVPCVLSPARAIWTWMTHRQQVRALFYATPLHLLVREVTQARRVMLRPSVVQPMHRQVRREHARRRLVDWIQYVLRLQERRAFMNQRQFSRSESTAGGLILSLLERTTVHLQKVYLTIWLRHRILQKFLVPMAARAEQTQLRNRFQLWRIATSRQYNIRVPRHLTMRVCGTEGLLPMPSVWIRRLKASTASGASSSGAAHPGTGRTWNVLYSLGNGNAAKVVVVTSHVHQADHHRPPSIVGGGGALNKLSVRKQLSGVNTQLYLLLIHLTQQRQLFHGYRVWRRFAEIARELRELQARQVRVVHAMEASAMSVMGTQRVLFGSWKRWARRRRHHKDILSATK